MTHRDLSLALFTDLYQFTMAQAYWQNDKTAPATFDLFFRRYPPDRAYFVVGGLEDALDYLEGFAFSPDDIAVLRADGRFDPPFLDFLRGLRFTGSVRAMPEGSIAFCDEPVLEVTGPVIEAQMMETYLLNQVHLQTILATKASRAVHVAQGRTLVDFGARRYHGTDAANKLARAAYMVGFAGTSNVLAGARYGVPTFGTVAHSFVTTFEREVDAFRAYARSFPDTSTFLVDTYDAVEGVRRAAQVALEMRRAGHRLQAVRLDSGDLAELAVKARAILDAAGCPEVQVLASGGLDEFAVDRLLRGGAPIDGFGVGTKIGVSADAPWADCAYKLVAYDGRPVLKLSSDKEGLPGAKQVHRFRDASGLHRGDLVALQSEGEPPSDGAPLLQTVMEHGRRLAPSPALETLRRRFAEEFARLPAAHKALRSPQQYSVGVSPALDDLRRTVAARVRREAQA